MILQNIISKKKLKNCLSSKISKNLHNVGLSKKNLILYLIPYGDTFLNSQSTFCNFSKIRHPREPHGDKIEC